MARRLKLLTGLSTIAVAGALSLSGCGKSGGEGEGAEGAAQDAAKTAAAAPSLGGEGAEGGAEGGSAVADKPSYLAQLMMLRGHLKAGAALYEAGEGSLAAVHMKHPHDELYMTLKPQIESYGARDIAGDLSAMAASVEGGLAVEKVEEALANVRASVAGAVAASKPTLKETLLAVSQTLRQAGAEYDEGVKDGAVVNLKEYQDAYGFMAIVIETLGTVEGANEQEKTAVAVSREQAALALAVAPSVTPPSALDGKASTIHGAAARVELAALALE